MKRSDVYAPIEQHYRANYEKEVKALVNRVGGVHNAEDIVQEAYTRACQYWNSFSLPYSFGDWFNQIVLNCARTHLSSERRHGMSGDEKAESISELNLEDVVFAKEITALISHEPEPNAYILRLYFVERYTDKDISNVTSLNINTIVSIIRRFRKKMKEHVKD